VCKKKKQLLTSQIPPTVPTTSSARMRRAMVWRSIAEPVWVWVFTVLLMVVDSIVGVWRKRKVHA
jgi:hypothetical protein